MLNRAVARLALFEKEADYDAFERVLAEAMDKHPTRLLRYMHLVLWPRADGELTDFVRWLTHTHVMRWHAYYQTSGSGICTRGRFKSFPVQTDEQFYTVMRYVERNALRAGLVDRAEDWQWSRLWRRVVARTRMKPGLSWLKIPPAPPEADPARDASSPGRTSGT